MRVSRGISVVANTVPSYRTLAGQKPTNILSLSSPMSPRSKNSLRRFAHFGTTQRLVCPGARTTWSNRGQNQHFALLPTLSRCSGKTAQNLTTRDEDGWYPPPRKPQIPRLWTISDHSCSQKPPGRYGPASSSPRFSKHPVSSTLWTRPNTVTNAIEVLTLLPWYSST